MHSKFVFILVKIMDSICEIVRKNEPIRQFYEIWSLNSIVAAKPTTQNVMIYVNYTRDLLRSI